MRTTKGRIFLAAAVLVAAGCAGRRPGGPVEPRALSSAAAPAAAPQEAPTPAPPDDSAWDWIRLKEGEWLGKELKYVRQRKIGFDSKKTGEQTFKWNDVVELRSPRRLVCVFEDPDDGDQFEVEGTVHVADGVVRVATEEGKVVALPRARLVAIVPKGSGRLGGFWTGRVSLGATVRRGNTNQLEYNGLFKLTGRGASTRFDATYNGVFSSLDGVPTSNQNRFDSRFDVFLSRYFFLTPLTLEVFSDPFQNIELRTTPGVGLGYYLLDQDELNWDVTLGAGYRATRFDSVPPGKDPLEETASVSAGTSVFWEATDDLDVSLTYGLQVGVPDTAATNHHLFTLFSFEIVKDLKLDVQFVWDRVGDPQADDQGDLPLPDDFRTTVGLGWKF